MRLSTGNPATWLTPLRRDVGILWLCSPAWVSLAMTFTSQLNSDAESHARVSCCLQQRWIKLISERDGTKKIGGNFYETNQCPDFVTCKRTCPAPFSVYLWVSWTLHCGFISRVSFCGFLSLNILDFFLASCVHSFSLCRLSQDSVQGEASLYSFFAQNLRIWYPDVSLLQGKDNVLL